MILPERSRAQVVRERGPSTERARSTERYAESRHRAGMTQRRPPPLALPDRAFARPLTLTAARRLGVSRRELAGPLWQPLATGVVGWFGLDPHDPMTRIRALALRLPAGTVLGGWAALHVHGVTELDGIAGPAGRRLVPVLVHTGRRSRVRPGPGIVVDRSALAGGDVVEVDGLLVTSAARACFDIMRRDGVEEGIVAGDAACRALGVRPAELVAFVDARPGTPGVPLARVAASLVEPGSASGPESRLRYVWVVEAGLSRPLVNPVLVDDWGRMLGVPDLLDDEAGFVGEYDGSHHRALRQHTADNAREETFEQANLIVVRATAIDLWPGRAGLVRRLREGHHRGLGRDRGRDRWGLRRHGS